MLRKFAYASVILGALVCLLAACAPVEFSPDGKRIVFCWSANGKSSSLFTMNTDGTQLQAVPGGNDGLLARWSPDGAAILFVDTEQNLKVCDLNRNTVATIGPNAAPALAWKEDSRQFAALFAAEKDTLELRRYRWPEATLVSRVPLPQGVGVASFGQMIWLRGREEVTFLGTDAARHSNVYMVSGVGAIDPLLGQDAVGIGQTADGRKLIWACPGIELDKNLLMLYQFDMQTWRAKPLPSVGRLIPINSESSRVPTAVDSVVFSPDAQQMAIVVQERPQGGSDADPASVALYIAGTYGMEAHLVQEATARTARNAPDPKEMLIPSWSHDGKRLAVLQLAQGRTSITLHNADGSGRTVLPLPGYYDSAAAQRLRSIASRYSPRAPRRSAAGSTR